jgi:hypothetical protein
MFAGRYLWWILIATGTFVFCAVYFDYVGWTIVQFSGCEKNSSSCGPLVTFLGGVIKPSGYWLCGGILLACMIARIIHLKLSLFWGVVAIIWFGASTSFPGIFLSIWEGHLGWDAASDFLPIPLLFLTLLAGYLLVPFEEDDRKPFGQWRLPRYAAMSAAAHAALWTFANQTDLPFLVAGPMHMSALAAVVARLQPQLNYLAEFGTGGNTPLYSSLTIFACALLASLLPQQKLEAAWISLQLVMFSGSPRRRSGRA